MKTIAAISTPIGVGAIGMIRISGKKTLKICKDIFIPKTKIKEFETRRAYFGVIKDRSLVVDQVILTVFKAPYSYTGEDIVEITCHGGRFILEKILNILFKKGIKPAEPGEFTKRAFLNGKLDLLQAEAVEDIILAENELALNAAQNLLSGKLTKLVDSFKQELIDLISNFEALIEFPDEEDIINLSNNKTLSTETLKIKKIIKIIDSLINSFDDGMIIKEGFQVSIFGAPNTGKSTLLNKFLGYDRAITSKNPGTTRDYIREKKKIKGIPVTFIDMAGLRDASNKIEKKGIEQSKTILTHSSIAIFMIDGSRSLSKNDEFALKTSPKNIPVIWVINKADKKLKINLKNNFFNNKKPLLISALNSKGIDKLLKNIEEYLTKKFSHNKNELFLTHIRHKNCLDNCKIKLLETLEIMKNSNDLELIVYDLYEALKELRILTGEVTPDDILNNIFSHFCIGK